MSKSAKVVTHTTRDKNVMSMFKDMIGEGEDVSNLKIIYPKYLRMKRIASNFIKTLELFYRSESLRKSNPDIIPLYKEFIDKLLVANDEGFSYSMGEKFTEEMTDEFFYNDVPAQDKKKFQVHYHSIKKLAVYNIILSSCSNFVGNKVAIDALDDKFLIHSPGNIYAPIHGFEELNFKFIYISDKISDSDKQFVLHIIKKLYSKSLEFYKEIRKPDVDLKEFIDMIINSLDDIKKKIPRCNEAFNVIANNAKLLEENFDSYYGDYIESDNPSIIMENFIQDVSKKTKGDIKLTTQFKTIINHY